MSETKFTKGEWELTHISDATYIDDDQGFTIARVYDCEGIIENAPLMRSAKDMYALLKYISGNNFFTTEINELLKKARGE